MRVKHQRRMRLSKHPVTGLLLVVCTALSGCFGTPAVYEPNRTAQTPPMRLQTSGEVIEVTLEAPNPGWKLEYDTTKASKEGPRLLFTVRRPDPGMIFPARVVEKTVRTDQPKEPGSRVWVRVRDHGEKGGRYSPTELIEPEPGGSEDRVESADDAGP